MTEPSADAFFPIVTEVHSIQSPETSGWLYPHIYNNRKSVKIVGFFIIAIVGLLLIKNN
jgi:hypothetical protein